MSTRNIEKIVNPGVFNWVGDAFHTTSFIGNSTGIARHRMDPFIAIGYNPPYEFTPKTPPRGVGSHPHKGFETLTLAYQGRIAHSDSKGNHGVIGEGDAQWMTAGSGILHQEYHDEEWSKTAGTFQMVQLWVNLPAKDKETPAHYQDLYEKDMTKVLLADQGGVVDVISGSYMGHAGKATTYSPMSVFNVRLNKGGKATFQFPNNYNTGMILIKGSVLVNGSETVPTDNFAMFENGKGDTFTVEATEEDTVILMLSGEPLNEPLVMYGPFVMNTEEQIQQAIQDFNSGKFGRI